MEKKEIAILLLKEMKSYKDDINYMDQIKFFVTERLTARKKFIKNLELGTLSGFEYGEKKNLFDLFAVVRKD